MCGSCCIKVIFFFSIIVFSSATWFTLTESFVSDSDSTTSSESDLDCTSEDEKYKSL